MTFSPKYTHFVHSIKLFENKAGMTFDGDHLVVGQNNYATKIVSAYVVFELNGWLKVPLNNSKFKKCLFCAINVVKNTNKNGCIVAM